MIFKYLKKRYTLLKDYGLCFLQIAPIAVDVRTLHQNGLPGMDGCEEMELADEDVCVTIHSQKLTWKRGCPTLHIWHPVIFSNNNWGVKSASERTNAGSNTLRWLDPNGKNDGLGKGGSGEKKALFWVSMLKIMGIARNSARSFFSNWWFNPFEKS